MGVVPNQLQGHEKQPRVLRRESPGKGGVHPWGYSTEGPERVELEEVVWEALR